MRKDVSGSRGPSLHPVAVTPLLKLVGSGGTAVKPTELLQAVGDVIVDGVYNRMIWIKQAYIVCQLAYKMIYFYWTKFKLQGPSKILIGNDYLPSK